MVAGAFVGFVLHLRGIYGLMALVVSARAWVAVPLPRMRG